MSQTNQLHPAFTPKPTWLIKGTCGSCTGFKVNPNETELAGIPCSNENSTFKGIKVGILGVKDCKEFDLKKEAPEGFVIY